MTENQNLSKPVRRGLYFPLLVGAILMVVVSAITIALTETHRPGYGWGSWLVKSTQQFAAAKAQHENDIAAKKAAVEKREAAYKERDRLANIADSKKRAENEILRRSLWSSIVSSRATPICPDPAKWATLGSDGQQQWHQILSSRNLPRIGDNCYLE